jgi:RNA polymerase sigma factor (sigma-70 family)
MTAEKNSADSQTLVKRLHSADEGAADEVFRRYFRRLAALARARLAPQVGRRVDPEDAVQSAFRSFFLGARSGRFTIERSGDLWRLLATITARKVSRLTTRHRGEKRSVAREVRRSDDADDDLGFLVAQGPSPEHAAALADELSEIMRSLPVDRRRALQLRLEDASVDDIAHEIGCTDRTVRRWLNELQTLLERRLIHVSPDASSPVVPTLPKRADEGPTAKPTVATTGEPNVPPLPPIDYRDFVLELHLGSGGMGRVYRAWQRSTDRHVAVKVLKKNRQQERAAVERFLTEAEMIASLDHPAIIQLFGLGRMPAGGYFFTMQLVEGGDLQQRIDAGPITLTRIIEWLRQAAGAVAHAHARGVIHCDLKPSNLLLDREERIVVSDFGFAVALSGKTSALGGTRAFIAPELFARGEVSARTDVWGLGAVLYALLYRKPPWPRDARPSANTHSIDWPTTTEQEELGKVCRRCLAVDPQDRYASIGELIAAIDFAANDEDRRSV